MNSIILVCNKCGTKNRIPADKQHLGPKCGSCENPISINGDAVPVELNDFNFAPFISQASRPVMVDFYSPTCGPCRMLAPSIDFMAKKFLGRIIIAKLDTSSNQKTAAQFRIRGVPSLLFFRNGQLIDHLTGALSEQELAKILEKFA